MTIFHAIALNAALTTSDFDKYTRPPALIFEIKDFDQSFEDAAGVIERQWKDGNGTYRFDNIPCTRIKGSAG